MYRKETLITVCSIVVILILGGLILNLTTDAAIQADGNIAFVPIGYSDNKIPSFVKINDKRDKYKESGTIYIRCPRNLLKEPHKTNMPEDYECRIYPDTLDDDMLQPLLQAKVMGLLDVYVEGFKAN